MHSITYIHILCMYIEGKRNGSWSTFCMHHQCFFVYPICMYACMHVCMYVCMCIKLASYTYILTYIYIYIYICTYIYIYIYIYIYRYVYIHTYKHTHTHTHTHTVEACILQQTYEAYICIRVLLTFTVSTTIEYCTTRAATCPLSCCNTSCNVSAIVLQHELQCVRYRAATPAATCPLLCCNTSCNVSAIVPQPSTGSMAAHKQTSGLSKHVLTGQIQAPRAI
jgi:hypothetical protein